MSVIAWDGQTLAADRRCCAGSGDYPCTKIVRVGDRLVGFAGRGDGASTFIAWAAGGFPLDAFPLRDKDDAENPTALVILPDGTIHRYERTPHPMCVESPYAAIGSGSPFATAALYLGHDARRAVEVAIALDGYCGMGIDTLTLAHDPSGIAPTKFTRAALETV